MIWTKETPVVLYGAAHVGTQVYKHLSGAANIIAFADKRADEIKMFMELPVYAPGSDQFTDEIKISSIVVVCVKNVFDHENITQELIGSGFSHVVFCPTSGSNFVYREDKERNALMELYSALTEGEFMLPRKVPAAQGLFVRGFSDNALIRREEGVVTAYVPAVFCYTRFNKGELLRDIPIMTLFPYFELFDSFDGNPEKGDWSYLEFAKLLAKETGCFETTDRWAKNVIDSRRMVYERIRAASELVSDFFVVNAITADWNPLGGYFNLNGGKHRAVYLIHKKNMYIPLKLTEPDYECFLNLAALAELTAYLRNEHVTELPYPVWHPYLANMPYSPKSNFYNLLCAFTRWLSKNLYLDRRKTGYSGITVLDCTDALLPLSRCLRKLGCAVTCEKTSDTFDFLVDDLYRETSAGPTMAGKYDVVLAYGEDMEQWREVADYGLFLLPHESEGVEAGLDVIGQCFGKNRAYVCAVGKGDNSGR